MIQGVLDHLWQSTLFAGAMGLLTWVFRGHGAHVRHGLWFAASVKFLLPFSLLIALGSHVSWQSTLSPVPAPVLSRVIAPFSAGEVIVSTNAINKYPSVSTSTTTALVPLSVGARVVHSLPLLALGLWACGSALVLGRWIARWQQIREAVKESSALSIAAPIPARSSRTTVEPGVIGFFRPVLLLPKGIDERLDASQLQSIVLHEIIHVRRRDNLTAGVHMLVEALFWFYPLIWWIGRQLIRERESACDEAVIESGCSPEAYAEGILNVCKFYLQLPIACAAGVAGADLQRRIQAIMTPRRLRRLSTVGAVLISSTALATLILPVALGADLPDRSGLSPDVRQYRAGVDLAQSQQPGRSECAA
jgi:beta-lactamase regulating signal transducer with metallopeptidase domain